MAEILNLLLLLQWGKKKKIYVDISQTTRLRFFLKMSVLLKADISRGTEEWSSLFIHQNLHHKDYSRESR